MVNPELVFFISYLAIPNKAVLIGKILINVHYFSFESKSQDGCIFKPNRNLSIISWSFTFPSLFQIHLGIAQKYSQTKVSKYKFQRCFTSFCRVINITRINAEFTTLCNVNITFSGSSFSAIFHQDSINPLSFYRTKRKMFGKRKTSKFGLAISFFSLLY